MAAIPLQDQKEGVRLFIFFVLGGSYFSPRSSITIYGDGYTSSEGPSH